MTQRPKRIHTRSALLRAIKGLGKEPSEIERLVASAWIFTHSVLWNDIQFSSKEVRAAQARINEYFQLSKEPRRSFQSFCQRIVLARYQSLCDAPQPLSLPSVWLDRSNSDGFGGTKSPYTQIKAMRESLPNFQRELKALGEAVLDFSEAPVPRNYRYWCGYFKDKQAGEYLRLFQSFAANHLFTA
jgi:hypothetical protein